MCAHPSKFPFDLIDIFYVYGFTNSWRLLIFYSNLNMEIQQMKQNPILTVAQNIHKKIHKKLFKEKGTDPVSDDYRLAYTYSTDIHRDTAEILMSLLRRSSVNGEDFLTERNDQFDSLFELVAIMERFMGSSDISYCGINSEDGIHIRPSRFLQVVKPFDIPGCRYRKMNPRVFNYIMSLGPVSVDLAASCMEEFKSLAKASSKGLYSEMCIVDTEIGSFLLWVVVNQSGRIYCTMRDSCHSESFVETDQSLWPEDYNRLTTSTKDLVCEVSLDILRDPEKGCKFDILTFFFNLHLAEKTNQLAPAKESNYDKQKIEHICQAEKKPYSHKDKDPSVHYEYITVTEDCWKRHTDFKHSVISHSGDKKWYKEHWWRKAHYMKAGKDKHLAFIEATICHRKCGAIEIPQHVVEVLR